MDFDFKDVIAVATFIIVLLTFIFNLLNPFAYLCRM